MIWVIAKREVTAMFLSPLAWIILAVVQIILGYLFLVSLDDLYLLQPQLVHLANTPGVTDLVITIGDFVTIEGDVAFGSDGSFAGDDLLLFVGAGPKTSDPKFLSRINPNP